MKAILEGVTDAAQFNNKYSVGSKFTYNSISVHQDDLVVKTESQAIPLGDSALVKVSDISGLVDISRLTPVNKDI
ncbi:hypothetical protein CJF42_25425, partial [Pseudoalteromonas sp. NBT06-2]|uniref:hypothetical protein n=1 Tax=Pseudoalteromonas sp. NBT06-2 TaxID=2025950 RepID=UPI000BC8215B